jgi:hypothetical protein
MFKVIRIFERSGYKKTILRCVTEEIAQLHCRSRETSSMTCTTSNGKRRTARFGPWKDVYEECC